MMHSKNLRANKHSKQRGKEEIEIVMFCDFYFEHQNYFSKQSAQNLASI